MNWIQSWFWYYVGDLCCKILEIHDADEEWCDRWYPRYNESMNRSTEAQGDYEGRWWPWGP